MIKYLVIDFDGTLVNTLPLTSEAVRRFLKYKGYTNLPTDEQVLEVMSLVGNEIIEHFMYPNKINMDEYSEVYAREVESLALEGKPFPNVRETLKTLKENGIGLYILSNKADETVRKYALTIFGEGVFDDYQGVIEGIEPKPAPYMINNLYKKYNLNPDEGLLVGDSEVDLETAINGKIRSCIMSYGYADKEKMKKLPKPDYVLDDFAKLIDIINEDK